VDEMTDVFTLKEVAEQFGRSTRWVREYLIAPHRVEAIKLNRKNIYVKRRSLEKFIECHTHHAFLQIRK
jgi:hypothetical protein